jgi:hypothetical protein
MKLFPIVLVLALFIQIAHATETPRVLSFDVPSSCNCASCTFDVHRVLSKFEGVEKVTLSGKDHRLNISFLEGKQPVSSLGLAVAKLDLGQGSSLLWPVPLEIEVPKAASSLGSIAGIAAAKADTKSRIVHLTFTGKTAVTLSQLDNNLKELAHENH